MTFLADIFLVSGTLVAALYCMILSRRLRKFTDLEHGVGGAVALLSAKTDTLGETVRNAQQSASQSVDKLEKVSARAESAARHLELLVASLHSLPDAQSPPPPVPEANPFRAKRANRNGAVS